MNGNFFALRFQHLLDHAAPDQAAAIVEDIDRLAWQPRMAAVVFKALQPLAVAGTLDLEAILDVAAQVAKATPGRDQSDALSVIFVVPKASFAAVKREKALNALVADGQVDSLAAFLKSTTPAGIEAAAGGLIRPSISSFNGLWEKLMDVAVMGALTGVADVVRDEAESIRAVEVSRQHSTLVIHKPDLFVDRSGVRRAHAELKGTSEPNQGDNNTGRLISDAALFCKVPAFSGLRYIAFISGAGFLKAGYFRRFDDYKEPRFILCTTDAEAPIFRALGSKSILSLTELAAVVATW